MTSAVGGTSVLSRGSHLSSHTSSVCACPSPGHQVVEMEEDATISTTSVSRFGTVLTSDRFSNCGGPPPIPKVSTGCVSQYMHFDLPVVSLTHACPLLPALAPHSH